jgi:alpha-1,3/alpha-1,6-mannosyltransferase
LISLNRFEKKKNVALAIESFALLRKNLGGDASVKKLRLVLAGMLTYPLCDAH